MCASRLTCGKLSMGELFVRGSPGQKVHCRRDWSSFRRTDSFLNAAVRNVVSYLNLYGHLLLLWMKWCTSVSSWLPARGYVVENVLGSVAFADTKYLQYLVALLFRSPALEFWCCRWVFPACFLNHHLPSTPPSPPALIPSFSKPISDDYGSWKAPFSACIYNKISISSLSHLMV